MLNAVEEPLDQVALSVEPGREGELLLSVGARRDVGPGVPAGGGIADSVAVIALVGQQRGALRQGLQQNLGLAGVVNLTSGQAQRDGTTVSVNEGMDFAREAASGTPHAAI